MAAICSISKTHYSKILKSRPLIRLTLSNLTALLTQQTRMTHPKSAIQHLDRTLNCDDSTPEHHMKTKQNTINTILININSVKSITKTTQLKTTIQSNNSDIMFLVKQKPRKTNTPIHSYHPIITPSERTEATMEVVYS